MTTNYGAILEEAIKAHGWSPEKLAVEAGTSPHTAAKALAGSERMNIPTLKKIAARLGYRVQIVLVQAETGAPAN